METIAAFAHNPSVLTGGVACVMARSPAPARRMTVAYIQAVVAEYFCVPVAEMKSRRRDRSIARPRQIAMWFARELTPMSYPDIGRRFGDKDHSTVMHGVRRVEQLIADDDEVALHIVVLRRRLAA